MEPLRAPFPVWPHLRPAANDIIQVLVSHKYHDGQEDFERLTVM